MAEFCLKKIHRFLGVQARHGHYDLISISRPSDNRLGEKREDVMLGFSFWALVIEYNRPQKYAPKAIARKFSTEGE